MRTQFDKMAFQLGIVALHAGPVMLDIYRRPFTAETKDDGSPVTAADLAADAVIREDLNRYWPDIPVISEETFVARHTPKPQNPKKIKKNKIN